MLRDPLASVPSPLPFCCSFPYPKSSSGELGTFDESGMGEMCLTRSMNSMRPVTLPSSGENLLLGARMFPAVSESSSASSIFSRSLTA